MNSIRHLMTCTSVATVLAAIAVVPTSAMADSSRKKLPSFAKGEFRFDEIHGMGLVDSLRSTPGHRWATAGVPSAADGSTPESREYGRSWFLHPIGASVAHDMGYRGKGVLTAVVDSGIDVSHPEFRGRISPLSRSFVPGTDPDDLSDLNPDGSVYGHGTFDAGIIGAARDGYAMKGVAPEATIMALRTDHEVMASGGYSSNLAILYAARNRAQVLNGSYAGPAVVQKTIRDYYGKEIDNPHYTVLPTQPVWVGSFEDDYRTLKAGADADMVMVFSAGNEFMNQPNAASSPAGLGLVPAIRPDNHRKGAYTFLLEVSDYANPDTFVPVDMTDPRLDEVDFSDLQGTLITVVATDRHNKITEYSNRCGIAALWCIAAPGGNRIEGTDPEFSLIFSAFPYSDYAYWAGTSMAAPVVSGAATVLRGAFPYFTARQTIEVILTSATNLGSPEIYGRGMLNLARAIKGPYEFGAEGFAQVFDVDTKGYDSTWSNDIRGTGGLVKRGDGNLLLAGDNTYAGGTEVLGGILTLNGSLSSSLSVGAKATLRGIGEINAPLTVAGILDPGGANGGTVGTLTVNSDAELLGTSTYKAGVIGRNGNHDRLEVSGRTTLSGGSLEINLADGAIPVNKPIDVLFSGEGVDGKFGKIATNSVSAFLDPTLTYDADVVSVTFLRNGLALASTATTANQASIAAAADSAGAGNGVHDVLALNSLASAGGAFDSASGEAHASVATSAYGDAALIGRTLLGRLGPFGAPAASGLWGGGFGSWGRIGSDGNAGSISTSTGGFVIGAEGMVNDDVRGGIAGGFTSTDTDMDARLSTATNESVFGAIYGSARWGAVNARLGASLSVHDIDVTRRITIPGLSDQAIASYDGTTVQAFGELGYRFGLGTVALEPFVGASVLRLHTDSFAENGGAASLTGYGQTYDLATTTLGLRAEARLGTNLPLVARGVIGWRHAYGDVAPKALLGLGNGISFGVSGAPVDRDAFVAEANLDWEVSKAVTLGVAYHGQAGSRAQDHAVKGSLSVRF